MPPEGACRSRLIRPFRRRTKAERQMRLFVHREAAAKESGYPAKNKQTNNQDCHCAKKLGEGESSYIVKPFIEIAKRRTMLIAKRSAARWTARSRSAPIVASKRGNGPYRTPWSEGGAALWTRRRDVLNQLRIRGCHYVPPVHRHVGGRNEVRPDECDETDQATGSDRGARPSSLRAQWTTLIPPAG
jgi:hypothetical protein